MYPVGANYIIPKGAWGDHRIRNVVGEKCYWIILKITVWLKQLSPSRSGENRDADGTPWSCRY